MTVGLEAEYEHTATLRFLLKDTGIGFPEDKTPFFFEPFCTGRWIHHAQIRRNGAGSNDF